MGFLKIGPENRGAPEDFRLQRFHSLKLSHAQPTAIRPNPRVGVPTYLWLQNLLLQVSRLCVQSPALQTGGDGLPSDFKSLMGRRKSVYFQFAQNFSVVRTGMITAKLFTYWS